MLKNRKKVALCILDGWGISPQNAKGNATKAAHYFWQLWKNNPHKLLQASGLAVGLPEGQMGNSEVGHMTLGLGRVVKQNLCKIDEAIKDGSFVKNQKFQEFVQFLKKKKSAAHVMGLVSSGGVHSHIQHMISVVNFLADSAVPIYIHAILDGRDTPPRSARSFLDQINRQLPTNARIVSICGRFYAMDRDQRWERTEDAYRLIAEQSGYLEASSYDAVFEDEYYQTIGDEFIEPIVVGEKYEENLNDGFIMINFRADRARQIMRALGDQHFDVFPRKNFPRFARMISMTEYDENFRDFCVPLFCKESIRNSLGEVLAQHEKKQVRIAETEKYAHVTFFLNGGMETVFPHEERILIPSPKVEIYSQAPEMSALRITNEWINAMRQKSNDVIIVNYANADMLGHTGNLKAAEKAIQTLDQCLEEVVKVAKDEEYILFVTADHGNAEQMINEDGTVNTAHTVNLVPFLAVHLPNSMKMSEKIEIGQLSDIAPTLLKCLDIKVPDEMIGQSLIEDVYVEK